LITYIVKYKQHEKLFTDVRVATLEAEKIGETGVNTFVYKEVDGVRDDEPFFSCTWGV